MLTVSMLTALVMTASAAGRVQKVVDYSSTDRTFYVDMTGNGQNDTVQVTTTRAMYDFLNGVKVYVNGKLALSSG